MKNSMNIVKKEMDKIFKNPRLIFSTFILPGLIIFLMYSFMGNSFNTENVDTISNIIVYNDTNNTINDTISNYELSTNTKLDIKVTIIPEELHNINKEIIDEFDEKINNKEVDAIIVFDYDFNNLITEYKNGTITDMPKINYYINSTITNSSNASTKIQTIINIICENINTRVCTVNPVELANEKEVSGQFLAMLLPMLIMVFVFAGGLSIGPDAIAGEKERGTMATLLMAPIKKEEIVFGKIISTVIITILSAISSFLGVALSLPNAGALFGGASITNYGFSHYVQLLLIIVLIGLLASALFLLASTLGKSNKEATAYSMPIYILAIGIGASTMFKSTIPSSITQYFIPIYNLTLGIKGVFLMQLSITQLLCIVVSTIIYFIIIIVLITKLFKSERLMFGK